MEEITNDKAAAVAGAADVEAVKLQREKIESADNIAAEEAEALADSTQYGVTPLTDVDGQQKLDVEMVWAVVAETEVPADETAAEVTESEIN